MWKKIVIGIITLIGSVSVISLLNPSLNASEEKYKNIKINYGQKLYIGDYNGEVVWDVMQKSGDTILLASSTAVTNERLCGPQSIVQSYGGIPYDCPYDATSPLYVTIQEINKTIFNDRELNYISTGQGDGNNYPTFLPTALDLISGLGLAGNTSRLLDGTPYWGADKSMYSTSPYWTGFWWHTVVASSDFSSYVYSDGTFYPYLTLQDEGIDKASFGVRPFTQMNISDLSFALQSTYSGTALQRISHDLSDRVGTNDSSNALKVRMKNPAYTIDFMDILNENDETISITTKDSKVTLQAAASLGEKHTVSLFIMNEENTEALYYIVLGQANADNAYVFDTANLPVGKYNLVLVNEEYDTSIKSIAYSSALSSSKPLEIVEDHSITYASAPQKGAVLGDYEYSKNVNGGDKIGTITYDGKGAPPIKYEIIGNGDGSFENFEIAGLNADSQSSSTSLDVKIKANAKDLVSSTKSLKAGTYKFCIVSTDANGSPELPTSKSKVCAELEVKKTQPTIAFESEDKEIELVTGSTTSSVPIKEHALHTNQDIISEGGNDHKILYTQKSGTAGLFNGLPMTMGSGGEITISTVKNKDGEIVLNAHIDATENYLAADTTKTIKVVLAIAAEYVEDQMNIKAGSTAAKPSTTKAIGHIAASGGTSPFTYAFKTGENQNGSFYLDTSTGMVYVDSSIGDEGLTPGNYIIKVLVTDSTSTTAQTASVVKTIVIHEAELSGVAFEDPDKVGSAAGSSITRTYDPSSNGGSFRTKLMETTIGSLTGTTITYSVEPSSNAVLEYSGKTGDYASFNVKKASSSSEKGAVLIKANVSGGVYGDTGQDVTIAVNVEKYMQEIEFVQKNPFSIANTASCTSIPATMKSEHWNKNDVSNKITYESNALSKVSINEDGQICPISGATGTATITATLLGDDNYTTATATIQINLVGELSITYNETGSRKQAVNPDKTNDVGDAKNEAVLGTVNVSGGIDKQYDIQIKQDDFAYQYISCQPDMDDQRAGMLKLKNGVQITASILKAGIDAGIIEQDATNKDQYNWTIQVLPDTEEEPQEIIVHIIGADPVLTFEKEVNNEISVVYKKDGTVDLSVKRGSTVLSTDIGIEGTTGYQAFIDSLANLTTDAQVNGIKIKKANCDNDDNVIAGKSIKVTPKAEASDGYKSGTGTATPVIIKKAEHPEVDFVDPDTILQSGVSSIDKGIIGIEPNDAHLTITPKNPVTWEGTTFEKIDSNHDVEPSVTIKPNGYEGTVIYVVNGGGTDNYKPIINKEIDLFFSSTGGITYKPIKITYGDDTKKVIDYITDGDKETNSYTYAPVEGTTYEDEAGNEILTLDDTTSLITTKQVGKTKVNVTRTESDGNKLTQAVPVEVMPKEITLTYESNTIYTGEVLPTPAFKEPDAGVLVGSDTLSDFPIPNEASHYKGTEVILDSNTAGTYDTKGNWTSDELATDVNPNYKVTIKAGKLTIKKDTAKDNWYHLEDQEGNTVSKSDWHNYYVDVVLDSANGTAGVYDQISNTIKFINVDKTRFTVTEEDENIKDVFFRINPLSSEAHKGAITDAKATVKIDITKPVITSMTGEPVNTDGVYKFINQLTLGKFYKPGVEVEIQASDPQPAGESSRTVSEVKRITYKIYTLDEKRGLDSSQKPQTGEGNTDGNGSISFQINKVGKYRVCAIAEDNATNSSKESCSDLDVKKIDVDIDGDGDPDFNDPDGDGCPDLNIVLGTDKDGNKIKLNVAEKGKSYPYMNIDSDGDGIADLNIDTDNDGRPDLNLVIMNEGLWKPKTCVVVEKLKDYSEPTEYCTGTDAKPQINVDTTGNGIPNINIDTTGDMKPDFNIDIDNDDKPDVNIGKVHTNWKPDKDYVFEGFAYDTMVQDKPLINVDSDGDGRPDLNIDIDGDGEPDLNIDADGNGIPETNIDSTGDGKPDTNVDTNGDGKPDENIIEITDWKPNKDVDGDIKYDTMDIERKSELEDNGVIVEKPDGAFLPNSAIKVNDISDTIDASTKEQLDTIAGEQEVKKVYDVEYLENNIIKQPDGSVKVKIPVDPLVKNAKVVIEKEDGSFEEVTVTEKDGYYVFETEYIGKVSVIGDVEETSEPDPKPTPNPEPNPTNPSTSVQGTYTTQGGTNSGMGGAYTGDETNMALYLIGIVASVAVLVSVRKRKQS